MGAAQHSARTAEITSPADWRYVISISRAHRRSDLEIYAFALRDRLPRCRIPLRAADPDVVLDLPTVFTRCYEVGGYDLVVDYTRAPSVMLTQRTRNGCRCVCKSKACYKAEGN